MADWPDIPWEPWRETAGALHLWSQIAGKYRLAHAPWINHSWHATLYVTPRGLTTGPVHDGPVTVTLTFDLCDHTFVAEATGGDRSSFPLRDKSVAEFFADTREVIARVGGRPDLHGAPNEMPDVIPFAEDHAVRPYDAGAVARFHAALLRIDAVFSRFRTAYLGKSSPVHLFWGAFDLAVTRFSGRPAPLHPGGFPNLPDAVTREAYSHEVASAGFWPGGNGVDEPMFYSYAYPTPDGMAEAAVQPDAAYWHAELSEFLLPYAAVQAASDPDAALLSFLHSAYVAAADAAGWDRAALECELGEPRRPRPVHPPHS